MNKIDFRSDTVTWPTEQMREAMATAEVGDDVYGEDPTVNELQILAAEMLGKEAALFVSSGTQGNLIAILAHTQRGEQAIVGNTSHSFRAEAGGMASLGGVMPHPLPMDEIGRMDIAAVERAISPNDPHYPITRLICTENTAGSHNGAAIPADYFASLRTLADRYGLRIHIDGARFFNATTALGIPPTEITQHVDSISVCLSKGLCAPIGSVLAGSHEFIERAHRTRKMLGGGMRQAGVMAAAGIVALREMTHRLHIDHANAKQLAEGLARIPGIVIDPSVVQTNLVFFKLADDIPYTSSDIAVRLRHDYGIWVSGGYGRHGFRAVTHYWITEKEVALLLEALREILATGKQD